MSTSARILLSTVFVMLFSIGIAPAQAQSAATLAENTWSGFTTIQYIRQNQTFGDDETYFTIAGWQCAPNKEFYFEASAAAHASMVKVALSAFMSSRQIRVKHVGCRVYNLWMR